MIKELSAGAIILRKKKKTWEILVIRDMNHNLTFPKGLIEKKEKHVDTAKREAMEETGIKNLLFIGELPPVHYFYQRGDKKISKNVYYSAFLYNGRQKLTPQTEEGISEILWLQSNQALKDIGYPKTNCPLLIEAIEMINT